MAWDTEGTKQKILDAALTEFAAHGPDGTTIDRIAILAGVNKERIYNYFGGKHKLFTAVLRAELASVAEAVPAHSFAIEDIGEYAGLVYDYHRTRPELTRLIRWEGLLFDSEVPDEALRQDHYLAKITAVKAGQDAGTLTQAIDADHLVFLVFALAGWWFAVPQVARMLTGPESEAEHARRRASVVEAAKRFAAR